MRLAIILALALAACTGKNAAKGTVEYVPVVPLAALEGAGGEQAADAAVGGEEAAGGALAGDAEVDAGAGDAGAELACVETEWTNDRVRGIDHGADLYPRCRLPCAVLTACALYYVDENGDPAACPCLTQDDSPRIYDECLLRCITGQEPERFLAFGQDDAVCDHAAMQRLAHIGATEAGDGLLAACHGAAE
jgi:hypothetical protein